MEHVETWQQPFVPFCKKFKSFGFQKTTQWFEQSEAGLDARTGSEIRPIQSDFFPFISFCIFFSLVFGGQFTHFEEGIKDNLKSQLFLFCILVMKDAGKLLNPLQDADL